MQLPPPSLPTRSLLLRLRNFYIVQAVLLTSLTIALVAWHWQQPKPYALGFSYQKSVPILLIAGVLINSISFYFQNRYIRTQLQQRQTSREFRVMPFALRFYAYNLAAAVGLSLIAIFPLIALLFFYWIYPIVFWLVPYHLLIGILLGQEIKRGLPSQNSSRL